MSMFLKQLIKPLTNKRLTVGLLLGVFLTVLGMAHSESLHRYLHCDAGQPNHQCAVTMLAAGQVDAASVAVYVAPPVAEIPASAPAPMVFVSTSVSLLPPGRAPPVVLS